jgi:hypothetical protein
LNGHQRFQSAKSALLGGSLQVNDPQACDGRGDGGKELAAPSVTVHRRNSLLFVGDFDAKSNARLWLFQQISQ